MTLNDLIVKIGTWMKEDVDSSLATDAINDAIESLWESLMTVVLQQFIGAPVNLVLANNTERVPLVTLADPTGFSPVVASIVSGALPGRNLNFKISFVTDSGSETLLSAASLIAVGANHLAQVASPPPNAGGNDYSAAYGYNVYAQDPAWGAAYFKVNDLDPVPIGAAWTEPVGGVFPAGVDGSSNQQIPENYPGPPSANTTGDSISFIEHLEVQAPSGEWQAWDQADIDSLIMRRMASSVGNSSPYSRYAWDLVGGNVVEIRPALGTAFTPRYFPVIRPRRLRFTGATVPFSNMPCEAFIRYFAISLLKLSDEEYQAASAWGTKAEQERSQLLKTAAKTTVKRNDRITPFMR